MKRFVQQLVCGWIPLALCGWAVFYIAARRTAGMGRRLLRPVSARDASDSPGAASTRAPEILIAPLNPNQPVRCRQADPDRARNRSRSLTPPPALAPVSPAALARGLRVVDDLDARQQRLHEAPVVNLVFVRDRVRVGPVADADLEAPTQPGPRQFDRQFGH
jgi:hypothetical protein